MKKMIVAFLAAGLMGSAFAQSTTPAVPQQQQSNREAVTPSPSTNAGASTAARQSTGELRSFLAVGAVVVVGAAFAFSSGGGGDHAAPNPGGGTGGTTGTTGTN